MDRTEIMHYRVKYIWNNGREFIEKMNHRIYWIASEKVCQNHNNEILRDDIRLNRKKMQSFKDLMIQRHNNNITR